MSFSGDFLFLFEDPSGRRWAVPDYAAPSVAKPELAYDAYALVHVLWPLAFIPDTVKALGISALCLTNDWSNGFTDHCLIGHPDPTDPTSPFWSDSRHCHPPEAVAEAAERLIAAIEAEHPEATVILEGYRQEIDGTLPEAKAALTRDMTWLKETCRFGKEEGLILVSMQMG